MVAVYQPSRDGEAALAKASPGAIADAIGVQLPAAAAGILARYPPGHRQHVVAIAAR